MSVTFYPHDEDVAVGSLKDKLEIIMEAAERYKAIVLDSGSAVIIAAEPGKRITPKEIKVAFNWQEIAKLLREIREMPENNASSKAAKADRLVRISEIYEVLRGAKMPKLESVRAALMNEANQLRASGGVPK
jgi:NAD(P)H-hydrate repair Nnr-like enzyme with NAD(P)H-hydrate dehydratase domain